MGPRSPPRPRRAAAQSPRRQSGASSRRNRHPLPRSSRSSRAPDRGRGAPSWEGAEAGPARRWLASCWREGKDEERENRGRDQILFFLLFFFSSREDLEISVYGGGRGGEKKCFFRPPLFQSLLLFSVSRLQVRKSDQLRAGALFLCLCLCRLCGSDAQSLSLGKKEREEERGGLPLLSPFSSLSLARALFSLLLLLLLFTLLSLSVSLSHFRSSLLREKLLLCPT